jgi:hypothetical protein
MIKRVRTAPRVLHGNWRRIQLQAVPPLLYASTAEVTARFTKHENLTYVAGQKKDRFEERFIQSVSMVHKCG